MSVTEMAANSNWSVNSVHLSEASEQEKVKDAEDVKTKGNESDSDISVGDEDFTNTSPTPNNIPNDAPLPPRNKSHTPPPLSQNEEDDDYFKPLKKLKMIPSSEETNSELRVSDGTGSSSPERFAATSGTSSASSHSSSTTPESPGQSSSFSSSSPASIITKNNKIGVKSFSIHDILNHDRQKESSNLPDTSFNINGGNIHLALAARRIVRPWHTEEEEDDDGMSICSSSEGSSSASPRPVSEGSASIADRRKDGNPLDALFQMTSKTFHTLKNGSSADGSSSHLNLFSSKQPPKKKRKSRTAFNNHQLFELEKRFLYQKYLSPADRDELSSTLGLSNAQVITWFQNRRAKLKRDMEELKKDVHTATLLSDHTVFIKTMTQMGLLKGKPMEQLMHLKK